jgi:hypothetical protein
MHGALPLAVMRVTAGLALTSACSSQTTTEDDRTANDGPTDGAARALSAETVIAGRGQSRPTEAAALWLDAKSPLPPMLAFGLSLARTPALCADQRAAQDEARWAPAFDKALRLSAVPVVSLSKWELSCIGSRYPAYVAAAKLPAVWGTEPTLDPTTPGLADAVCAYIGEAASKGVAGTWFDATTCSYAYPGRPELCAPAQALWTTAANCAHAKHLSTTANGVSFPPSALDGIVIERAEGVAVTTSYLGITAKPAELTRSYRTSSPLVVCALQVAAAEDGFALATTWGCDATAVKFRSLSGYGNADDLSDQEARSIAQAVSDTRELGGCETPSFGGTRACDFGAAVFNASSTARTLTATTREGVLLSAVVSAGHGKVLLARRDAVASADAGTSCTPTLSLSGVTGGEVVTLGTTRTVCLNASACAHPTYNLGIYAGDTLVSPVHNGIVSTPYCEPVSFDPNVLHPGVTYSLRAMSTTSPSEWTTSGDFTVIAPAPSECVSGQTESTSCGSCGTQTRACVNGKWGTFGGCSGQGCTPNAVETCANGGMRTCAASTCTWSNCSAPPPSDCIAKTGKLACIEGDRVLFDFATVSFEGTPVASAEPLTEFWWDFGPPAGFGGWILDVPMTRTRDAVYAASLPTIPVGLCPLVQSGGVRRHPVRFGFKTTTGKWASLPQDPARYAGGLAALGLPDQSSPSLPYLAMGVQRLADGSFAGAAADALADMDGSQRFCTR